MTIMIQFQNEGDKYHEMEKFDVLKMQMTIDCKEERKR